MPIVKRRGPKRLYTQRYTKAQRRQIRLNRLLNTKLHRLGVIALACDCQSCRADRTPPNTPVPLRVPAAPARLASIYYPHSNMTVIPFDDADSACE